MNVNPRRARLVGAGLLLAVLLATVASAQDAQQRRGFSIAITTPENQEPVFGKTEIAAKVEIPGSEDLDRVEFVVGDDVVFVDREPPYECVYDFGEESRSWVIRAVAYHVEGISVSDAVITRKVPFSAFERVNRVVLWLTVTNKQGELLTDLKREEFRVLENGGEQKIIDFYLEDRPITMAILIDTSGSMQGKMDEVHDAAGDFVSTLRAEDRALIIDFDDKVFLIQDLTSDHEALRGSIRSTEPLGATAIFDALHASYRKIGKIEGRKAIVLLSDGDDTASQFSYKRVLEEAKSNSTIIYAIGLGGELNKRVLREFADVTGGRAFFVKRADELAEVYRRIADELRTQFYLTYSTSIEEWDGRWMKIDVETSEPGREIRHRRGYFAVK